MTEPAVNHPYFQVGVLVQDLDAAREELASALGVDWSDIVEPQIGEWRIRACFARQGPPYLELIEGPPGSPWDATGGSRIDHIGYWVDNLEASKQRLVTAGVELDVDGPASGMRFTYQRGTKSGLRIELLDAAMQASFYESFGLEAPDA